jgi:hypothetical protein
VPGSTKHPTAPSPRQCCQPQFPSGRGFTVALRTLGASTSNLRQRLCVNTHSTGGGLQPNGSLMEAQTRLRISHPTLICCPGVVVVVVDVADIVVVVQDLGLGQV